MQPVNGTSADDPFWCRSAAEFMSELGAAPSGLSSADAAQRLHKNGRNAIAEGVRHRMLGKIMHRLADPLIAILAIAAAVSGVSGDWASCAIILAILAISIGLEVIQEQKAENAVEALKRTVAVHAAVRRDGKAVPIPVEEIVAGDVVELGAGDFVPADGIVLEAEVAQTNESLLTGEAFPVDKRPGPCAAPVPAEAFNALFSGTVLARGTALMLVTATGSRTRFGAIAAALESSPPPASLERGLHAFSVLIVRMVAFLVLFVLFAHLAASRPVIESFLFAVALAVGMTPELLPMIMTVTLSRGAVRMAERKVVVKRLAAIHDLGAMNVLCTDKTGTLTLGSIALTAHPGADGADSRRVLELAAVNSGFESRMRSPLDEAILAGARDLPLGEWRAMAEVPFDYERRRVSVLAEHAGRRLLIVKGAPEDVMALSTRWSAPMAPCMRSTRPGAQAWRKFATTRPRKGFAASASAGASSRAIVQARRTKRNWCSPASACSSIRPRRRPPRRSNGWRPPASASRSSPATPRRPCSIWSRPWACRRADC